ncbi:MAG: LysR substrate-binding domain-containing protein [Paracoccaceae bacterium]|jgi:LysR family hydrogen peroxide-inducible transcriptional activator|nr:LysR substrate-binding domain-containing protein [Paracoccaceae bacterium]
MSALPTLRQLRYLIAVAEQAHFGRAAARLGISQPSLSLQIGNLEDVLGLRLVERGRGPVTLTPAGREVLARARRVRDEVQGIVDLAATMGVGLVGTLRLGTTPTIGPYLLPRVVARLHADFPDLRLYVRESAPRPLRDALVAGEHDLILTQLPEPGTDLVAHRLFREPLTLAVPKDHPLATEDQIEPAQIAGLSILGLSPAYALHDQIAGLCRDHGAEMVRDYEGTSLDALRAMVGMGMGAAFLPRLYVASELAPRDEGVVAIPFKGARVTRTLGLVWRRSAPDDAAYRKLADILRDVARARFRAELIL